MSDNPEALRWWTSEIAPFRAELRNLGCVHLDTAILATAPDVWTCVDYWLHAGGTFIDLHGNYVRLQPVRGVPHGFLSVTFNTWTSHAADVKAVLSVAEKIPRPKAHGLAAFIAQRVFHPLSLRLFPACRTQEVGSPADVAQALAHHLQTVARSPGSIVQPPANALEWRWQRVEADERAVPRSPE